MNERLGVQSRFDGLGQSSRAREQNLEHFQNALSSSSTALEAISRLPGRKPPRGFSILAPLAVLTLASSAFLACEENSPLKTLRDTNGDGVYSGLDYGEPGSEIFKKSNVFSDVSPDGRPDGLVDENDLMAVEGAVGTSAENPYSKDGVWVYRGTYNIDRGPDGQITDDDVEIVRSHLGEEVDSAFGLSNPGEINCGIHARLLGIGLAERLNEEEIEIFLADENLLLIDSNARPDSPELREHNEKTKGTEEFIPPITLIVDTSGRHNPDNLGGITQELKRKYRDKIDFVEHYANCGGPL